MPFKSEKQRRWMHANKPKMAQEWERKEKGKGKGVRKAAKKKTKKRGSKKGY